MMEYRIIHNLMELDIQTKIEKHLSNLGIISYIMMLEMPHPKGRRIPFIVFQSEEDLNLYRLIGKAFETEIVIFNNG